MIDNKKGKGIRRGTIVEISDWTGSPKEKKSWLVQRVYLRGDIKLAILKYFDQKEHSEFHTKNVHWTVADLKKIGFKKLPSMSPSLSLSEMDWDVSVGYRIYDNGQNSHYFWKAWAQESKEVFAGYGSFRPEFYQPEDRLGGPKTRESCLKNWNRFSKINGLPYNQEGFSNSYLEPVLFPEFTYCGDLYILQHRSLSNDFARLDNRKTFSCGGLGNCNPLTGNDLKKRLQEMEKSGDMTRWRIAKKLLWKRPDLIRFYDNFLSMTQSSSPRPNSKQEQKFIKEERSKHKIEWSMNN